MAELDLRVRILGRLLSRIAIADQSLEQIRRSQERPLPHTLLTDLLLGAPRKDVATRDGSAAGADGPVRVRAYRPGRTGGLLPLVLLFHGGGWTTGDLNAYDWLAGTIAAKARSLVVSVAYRLAPARRFPAAAEDCYAALLDVAARAAEWGADPSHLAVVGDSAGGNLAAVVSLMARDRSGPSIAFQGLLYPATDLTASSPSIDENAHAPVLTKRDVLAFRDHYLGGQDPRNPYASPLLADDLSGLPPALVQVAEHDPIRDDGLRYAAALEAAGVAVRTTQYFGMPHGYLAFPHLCSAVPQAMGELTAELRAALAPASAAA
ncbi:alpha/beta hydrolase [Amnibacterium sp.]|uniref:alpha/beta hydrolase n=1 Tax=Amnibacterium sp. TaxID=1872496 RepID=UPI002621AF14|nr:alpha/beta hydrolase [Amnibacterium sp.]MCU1472508.1 putative lipase [Amnibacterium sp.]